MVEPKVREFQKHFSTIAPLLFAAFVITIGITLISIQPKSAFAPPPTTNDNVTIIKQTDPDGSPQVFNFTSSFLSSFSLSDGQNITFTGLSGGQTLTFTEIVPFGWNATVSITCDVPGYSVSGTELSIELPGAESENFVCTFLNHKLPTGNITVAKETIPDGNPEKFNFTGNLGDFTLGDGQNMTFTMPIGFYGFSETDMPLGWAGTTVECSDSGGIISSREFTTSQIPHAGIRLNASDAVTCTFTNEIVLGNITIIKQTTPDNSTQLFNFTGDLGNFTLGDGQNMTFTVPSGAYNVGEIIPTGWSPSPLIQCSSSTGSLVIGFSIILAPSGTVTCTYINEQILSNITIIKQTIPDNSTQLFNFTGDLGNFTLGDGQNVTFTGLETRGYNITELVPPGWNFDIACFQTQGSFSSVEIGSSIRITPGIHSNSDIICTVTNEADRGTIIVEKQTIPNGAPGSFIFTGDAAGTIGDNGTIVVPNLLPGNYSATEVDPAPFILNNITCNDTNSFWNVTTRTATFVLEPGEVVKCTFTNTNVLIVEIDIKPGSDPNAINLKKDKTITVAILGNTTFNVNDIDVNPISEAPKFGGATPQAPIRVSYKDVNNDGFTDLVLQYKLVGLGFTINSTEGCISGKLIDGTIIEGCDSVKVVPK